MRQFDRYQPQDLRRASFPRAAQDEQPEKPKNIFEELLSSAAQSIRRGTALPHEAVAAIKRFFELIGTNEEEMLALPVSEIQKSMREEMSGYVGKALGLLGKADVRNEATHVRGMQLLTKAAELCPDDRRILLELSNAGHSVQWGFLKRAVANSIGKEPSHDAVRRERIREEVAGLRATRKLLKVLEMNEEAPDLSRAKQFLVGIWALSNAAHYYYTLGTLKAQGNDGVEDQFKEYGKISAKQCWREAIRYSRAVLDYFGVPAVVDDYYDDIGRLMHHRQMERAVPETVGGVFSISGLAFRDLGDLRKAVICLRVATELSPASPMFIGNYQTLLRDHRLTNSQAEAMLMPLPPPVTPPSIEARWEAIEKALDLSDVTRAKDFVGTLWRHFDTHPRTAELFIQYYRSEPVISRMWEIAAEPDGLRRVNEVHELLRKLEPDQAVKVFGVQQAIAQYDEILAAMNPN